MLAYIIISIRGTIIFTGLSHIRESDVLPIRPWASRGDTSPLRGNFGDSDFLKDYNVSIQNQVVCILGIGAFESYYVMFDDDI